VEILKRYDPPNQTSEKYIGFGGGEARENFLRDNWLFANQVRRPRSQSKKIKALTCFVFSAFDRKPAEVLRLLP
jgi:hypothetical protein